MARCIAEGAGANGRLLPAQQVTPEVLMEAGGFVFVCPENLAAMSGQMKEMFDRNYYPVLGRIEGRAYATAVSAGSDGTAAQRQIDRIATGWRLKRVADSIIINCDAQTPEEILAPKRLAEEQLNRCRDLGKALGQGLAMGVF